jgi:hypothetical protein
MLLTVRYLDGYPDVLPELSLEAVKGTVDNDEIVQLLDGLLEVVSWTFDRKFFNDPSQGCLARRGRKI